MSLSIVEDDVHKDPDELNNDVGVDNQIFENDQEVSELPISTLRHRSISIIEEDEEERNEEISSTTKSKKRLRYKWKMSHYFYVHMFVFMINGLLGGLIIFLIENHSVIRSPDLNVTYIDAWFFSMTCVSTCGLTTLDFAKLSFASQMVMMFLTFISGITISTLPALAIKAYTHKHVAGIRVDDDHGKSDDDEREEEDLPTVNMQRRRNLPPHIREQIRSLPSPRQVRFRAYVACFVLTLATCFAIYLIGFIAIGTWLKIQYTPEQLMQDNSTVNPWYISFIVVLTGFNQNGLTPFSTGFSRFIFDLYLSIFVTLVVMFGTSLFPFLLHNVVVFIRLLVPWRHKVIFDYILTNNHRLSTLLFPVVQTRIYLLVTVVLSIMGVGISLILDFNREPFIHHTPGMRLVIFLFHTINARFAGFQTVDMNAFAAATALVYILLMATKPQMLCSLDESPLELAWLALHAEKEAKAEANMIQERAAISTSANHERTNSIGSASTGIVLPMRHMKRFLRRQSLVTKDLVRHELDLPSMIDSTTRTPRKLSNLRKRLFLIHFARALMKSVTSLVISTRTWLFFFIFLICAIEYERMAPVDSEISVYKIIYEVISAFGTVGLTLGYPNTASSFSTVLSPTSKVIIILTMFMGRHRGLLDSMKDQEAIEYNAAELLQRTKDKLIHDYECKQMKNIRKSLRPSRERSERF